MKNESLYSGLGSWELVGEGKGENLEERQLVRKGKRSKCVLNGEIRIRILIKKRTSELI